MEEQSSFVSGMPRSPQQQSSSSSSSPLIRTESSVSRFRPSLLSLVVLFSALTGFLLGFDLSIVAVVLNPINDEFALCRPKEFTCLNKEIFVAMIAPGALVGSLCGGVFADLYGRRLTLALSDFLFIAGSVMFYFARSWAWLLAARCVVGLGVGIGFVVFSAYVTEISPPDRRGRLVLCQEIAQCVGVVLTFMVGASVDDRHWRLLLLSGSLGAILQLGGITFLPESPRWLLLQGDIIKARKVMRRLKMDENELLLESCEGSTNYQRLLDAVKPKTEEEQKESRCSTLTNTGTNTPAIPHPQQAVPRFRTPPPTPEDLVLTDIVASSPNPIEGQSPASRPPVLRQLWSCKKVLLIACTVGVAQNVLCTNASLYFSTDLMLIAGICKPYKWGIGLGLMKLLGTIVTYNLVDSIGRRRLLMWGTSGLGVAFVALAAGYVLVPLPPDVSEAGMFCESPAGANLGPSGLAAGYSVVVLMSLFALLFFWEISWAGLMYVVASEIIPSSVRGVGMGLVVACFWVSLFISQLCFELSFTILSVPGTFLGLAGAAVAVLAFTFFAVPDVTGEPLYKVQRIVSH